VDTDILIDNLRRIETAITRLEQEEQRAALAISSVTRWELLSGCSAAEHTVFFTI